MPGSTNTLLDEGTRLLRELAVQQGLGLPDLRRGTGTLRRSEDWMARADEDVWRPLCQRGCSNDLEPDPRRYQHLLLDVVPGRGEASATERRAYSGRGAVGQASTAGSRLSSIQLDPTRVAIVNDVDLSPVGQDCGRTRDRWVLGNTEAGAAGSAGRCAAPRHQAGIQWLHGGIAAGDRPFTCGRSDRSAARSRICRPNCCRYHGQQRTLGRKP